MCCERGDYDIIDCTACDQGIPCVDEHCPGSYQRRTSMNLLPYWFYLAGSICFAVGTLIVLWEAV